jgi:hypothetical protein
MGSESVIKDSAVPINNIPIDIVNATSPLLNRSLVALHSKVEPSVLLALNSKRIEDSLAAFAAPTTADVKPELFGDYFRTSTWRHSKVLSALNAKRDSLALVASLAIKKPIQTEIVQASGSCFLIAGVFRVKENAENYVKRWKERGYPAEVIVQPSGMHYVSIQRGETEEELLSFRNSMQKTKDPLPWVWISQE